MRFRKVRDLTGRTHTGEFGIGGTDLGIVVTMPNGELLCVFGDTFEQDTVGGPGWRSPVGLVGYLDEDRVIQWTRASGNNPDYAQKFWGYYQGGVEFSTVLPSDAVVVGNTIYLHVMVNKGLGNVVWTEIWRSVDNARSWQHLYKIDHREDAGHAQLWTWDYSPEENYIYAYTTGFQRNKGLVMRRIRADQIHRKESWEKWGWNGSAWGWRDFTSVIYDAQKFGEMSLRRMREGLWVLVNFNSTGYRIDARVMTHPTANLHTTPIHTIVDGGAWGREDHQGGRVAQLYGAYTVPGSEVGVTDGFDIVISQWNTGTNWPYKSMQFRGSVPDLGGRVVDRTEVVRPTEPADPEEIVDPDSPGEEAPSVPVVQETLLVRVFKYLFGIR